MWGIGLFRFCLGFACWMSGCWFYFRDLFVFDGFGF